MNMPETIMMMRCCRDTDARSKRDSEVVLFRKGRKIDGTPVLILLHVVGVRLTCLALPMREVGCEV